MDPIRELARQLDPQRHAMLNEYPSFQKFEQQIMNVIASHPNLTKLFNSGDRFTAYERGYHRLGELARAAFPGVTEPAAVAQWRTEMSIPSSGGGLARTMASPDQIAADRLQGLRRKMERSPRDRVAREAYVLARLRQSIAHPDLDALEAKQQGY